MLSCLVILLCGTKRILMIRLNMSNDNSLYINCVMISDMMQIHPSFTSKVLLKISFKMNGLMIIDIHVVSFHRDSPRFVVRILTLTFVN